MTNEELEQIRKRYGKGMRGSVASVLARTEPDGKLADDIKKLLTYTESLHMELYPHGSDTPENIMSSAFACADARCNMLLLVIGKLDLPDFEKSSLRSDVLAGRRALRIAANGDAD